MLARLWPREYEDEQLQEAYFAAVTPGLGAADDLLEAQLAEAFEQKALDPDFDLDTEMQRVVGQRVKGINDTTRAFVYDTIRVAQKEGYSIYQIADGVPDEGFPGLRSAITETYKDRSETIARTELAYMQNIMAVDRYHRRGVTEVEIMDGDGCGWASHDDGDIANGSVRLLEEFLQTPLAHPRCVRVPLPVVGDMLRAPATTGGGYSPAQFSDGMFEHPVTKEWAWKAWEDSTNLYKDAKYAGDSALQAFMDAQGYYGAPTRASVADVLATVEQGGIEMMRGVKQAEWAEDFLNATGTYRYTGQGLYGNGIYTARVGVDRAAAEAVAEGYAGDGVVTHMALRPGARVIDYDDLLELQNTLTDDIERRLKALSPDLPSPGDAVFEEYGILHGYQQIISDSGRLATLYGYDAIDVPRRGFMVVLNRTAVIGAIV